MNIDHLRPKTLTGIKSLAKAIKKRDGVPHSDALDRASVQAGFTDYRHALASISELKV